MSGGTGGALVALKLPSALHYWNLDETGGGTASDSGYEPANGNVVNLDDWSPDSGIKGGAFEVMDGASKLSATGRVCTSRSRWNFFALLVGESYPLW